jgi:aspartyl-tRNA(Asn)/glutamyl-tRNA(Gln) amidotransferase subunit A
MDLPRRRVHARRGGLPIGVQVVSARWAESTMLELAALLEAVSPVRGRHPEL